jgi:hypothetical protein
LFTKYTSGRRGAVFWVDGTTTQLIRARERPEALFALEQVLP